MEGCKRVPLVLVTVGALVNSKLVDVEIQLLGVEGTVAAREGMARVEAVVLVGREAGLRSRS